MWKDTEAGRGNREELLIRGLANGARLLRPYRALCPGSDSHTGVGEGRHAFLRPKVLPHTAWGAHNHGASRNVTNSLQIPSEAFIHLKSRW